MVFRWRVSVSTFSPSPTATSTIYATSLSSLISLIPRLSRRVLTQFLLDRWITWWQIPVLGMAYTNLDIALGNSGNKLLATNLLTYNAVADYMIDEYIDDQSQSLPHVPVSLLLLLICPFLHCHFPPPAHQPSRHFDGVMMQLGGVCLRYEVIRRTETRLGCKQRGISPPTIRSTSTTPAEEVLSGSRICRRRRTPSPIRTSRPHLAFAITPVPSRHQRSR